MKIYNNYNDIALTYLKEKYKYIPHYYFVLSSSSVSSSSVSSFSKLLTMDRAFLQPFVALVTSK